MKKIKYKLSNRDKKIIIIFSAVLLLFAAYRFVFSPNMKYSGTIHEEINQLKIRESELLREKARAEEVTDENREISNEIKNIISRYGAGATTQKTLVFLEGLQQETGMEISVINFSAPENIYTSKDSEESSLIKDSQASNSSASTGNSSTTASGNTVSENSSAAASGNTVSGDSSAAAEGDTVSGNTSSQITGYNSVVSIEFKVSSDGLTKSIDYINKSPERKNIRDINLVYDMETGNLSGSMKINMYQLNDVGKTYEDPTIAGVDIGTKNLFGTIDVPTVKNNIQNP